jgi:hypothetical protein
MGVMGVALFAKKEAIRSSGTYLVCKRQRLDSKPAKVQGAQKRSVQVAKQNRRTKQLLLQKRMSKTT